MKKIAAAFILLCITAFPMTEGAAAQAVSVPYAVIGEDVWMLDAETGEKRFLLPATYYAAVERMDETYYYLSFNGYEGKVPKAGISVVGYDKPVRDTQRIVRIAPEYLVFTEIRLTTSMTGEESFTVPTASPLLYVGSYKQGESTYYFVQGGEDYGYVLNTYTDSPTVEIAPFHAETDEEETPENEQGKAEKPKKSEVVKICVIGGVSAAALLLVVILFLPRKNKRHKYYYS